MVNGRQNVINSNFYNFGDSKETLENEVTNQFQMLKNEVFH